MDRAIIMICDMQYVMGRANAICDANTLWAARMRYAICECDMRIPYGPRECDMRYANTLWAARMRYAIREYVTGRANAICDTRIREYATGRANAIRDTRIGYARYTNTLWNARI